MKFKLDENLGLLGKTLLEAKGHDVMTVVEQRLSGAKDASIYEVCRDEGRVSNGTAAFPIKPPVPNSGSTSDRTKPP